MKRVLSVGVALALGVVQQDRPQAVLPVPDIPMTSPFAAVIADVPSITVETTVGMLPRLPSTVRANFKDGTPDALRTEVPVIWPAPTDNSAVSAPGSYSVTGR